MVKVEGWRYYNHAALPDVPPHIKANTKPVRDGSIWKMSSKVLFASWISDYDCDEETDWWYVIKDDLFDISALKAKRRYEITKGKKNFVVREINPVDFKEEIYTIQREAYSTYPEKYRPTVVKKDLFFEIPNWSYYKFYGAFSVDTNLLVGYAWLNRMDNYIYYAFHKVIPTEEKKGVNAAIVSFILEEHNSEFAKGIYICDGSRNVSHETGFQDYLEKYFGFRKAYCRLHIKYRFIVGLGVKILYPFRKKLISFDNISLVHNINAILKMEEIVKKQYVKKDEKGICTFS